MFSQTVKSCFVVLLISYNLVHSAPTTEKSKCSCPKQLQITPSEQSCLLGHILQILTQLVNSPTCPKVILPDTLQCKSICQEKTAKSTENEQLGESLTTSDNSQEKSKSEEHQESTGSDSSSREEDLNTTEENKSTLVEESLPIAEGVKSESTEGPSNEEVVSIDSKKQETTSVEDSLSFSDEEPSLEESTEKPTQEEVSIDSQKEETTSVEDSLSFSDEEPSLEESTEKPTEKEVSIDSQKEETTSSEGSLSFSDEKSEEMSKTTSVETNFSEDPGTIQEEIQNTEEQTSEIMPQEELQRANLESSDSESELDESSQQMETSTEESEPTFIEEPQESTEVPRFLTTELPSEETTELPSEETTELSSEETTELPSEETTEVENSRSEENKEVLGESMTCPKSDDVQMLYIPVIAINKNLNPDFSCITKLFQSMIKDQCPSNKIESI